MASGTQWEMPGWVEFRIGMRQSQRQHRQDPGIVQTFELTVEIADPNCDLCGSEDTSRRVLVADLRAGAAWVCWDCLPVWADRQVQQRNGG